MSTLIEAWREYRKCDKIWLSDGIYVCCVTTLFPSQTYPLLLYDIVGVISWIISRILNFCLEFCSPSPSFDQHTTWDPSIPLLRLYKLFVSFLFCSLRSLFEQTRQSSVLFLDKQIVRNTFIRYTKATSSSSVCQSFDYSEECIYRMLTLSSS